jgi:hypothetical protein
MAKQYIEIDSYGDKFYYKDPEKTIRHRTDGPATEFINGYKAWYVNGVLHRVDGPAVEHVRGDKTWYINGVVVFETDRSGNILRRILE